MKNNDEKYKEINNLEELFEEYYKLESKLKNHPEKCTWEDRRNFRLLENDLIHETLGNYPYDY